MISMVSAVSPARLARGCALLLALLAPLARADAAPTSAPPDEAAGALSELLAHAEQHSPALHLARERRTFAAAARAGAEPWLDSNPTLGIAVGPRFAGASGRALDVQVSVAQAIDIAGARGVRRAAAGRVGQRLEAELALARLSVRHAVVQAFHSALVTARDVTLAEQALQFAERERAISERRLDAGDATAIDVRLSRAEVTSARQALLRAQRSSLAARIELATAAGYPASSPPSVPPGLVPPRALPPLAALLEGLDVRHPELAVRRAALSEARARVELSDREAWPVPVLGVQLSREGGVQGPDNHIVLGTLQLPLPLWQRNQGQRAQSRAEAATLRAEQNLAQRELEARVARAHAELGIAAARLELFAADTATLSDTLTLIERGFEAGEIPLLDVLAARQRFVDVERARLEAYAEYYRALAELEYAAAAGLVAGGAASASAPVAEGAP